MTPLPPMVKIVLAILVLLAAFYDLRERRIPNWLTIAGMIAGIGFAWKPALAGIGLALAAQIPFWLLGKTGAGDVKLMAAIGALTGPLNWVFIFAVGSIASGVGALVQIKRGRTALPRAPYAAGAAIALLLIT